MPKTIIIKPVIIKIFPKLDIILAAKAEVHKSARAQVRGQSSGNREQRSEARGEGQEVREWKFLFNFLSPILYSLYAILSPLTSHLSSLISILYSLFAIRCPTVSNLCCFFVLPVYLSLPCRFPVC